MAVHMCSVGLSLMRQFVAPQNSAGSYNKFVLYIFSFKDTNPDFDTVMSGSGYMQGIRSGDGGRLGTYIRW